MNEFNKEKRKYFKCKKVNYIRRFYRSKENLSKEKKDTLTVFKESKKENVLKKKKIKTRNFNYFLSIISRLLEIDSTRRETDRYRNMYNYSKKNINSKERTKY